MPKKSDVAVLAAIRLKLHDAVTVRFADIYNDDDRSALLASFFHPFWASRMLERDDEGVLDREVRYKIFGKPGDKKHKSYHNNIVYAGMADLPERYQVTSMNDMGVESNLFATEVAQYLTAIKNVGQPGGFKELSPQMDVLKLTYDPTSPYVTMPGVAAQARSYTSALASSALTEGSFSMMGFLHNSLRSRLSPQSLASIAYLTDDARKKKASTRKHTAWSQVDAAVEMLSGKDKLKPVSRALAIQRAKQKAGIVQNSTETALVLDDAGDEGEAQAAVLAAVGESQRNAMFSGDGYLDLDAVGEVVQQLSGDSTVAEAEASDTADAPIAPRLRLTSDVSALEALLFGVPESDGASGGEPSAAAASSSAGSSSGASLVASGARPPTGKRTVNQKAAASSAAAKDLAGADLTFAISDDEDFSAVVQTKSAKGGTKVSEESSAASAAKQQVLSFAKRSRDSSDFTSAAGSASSAYDAQESALDIFGKSEAAPRQKGNNKKGKRV